jgi:hypothetical protein
VSVKNSRVDGVSAIVYSFSERDSAAGVALADALNASGYFFNVSFEYDEADLNGTVKITSKPGGYDVHTVDAARSFAAGFVRGLRFQGATQG